MQLESNDVLEGLPNRKPSFVILCHVLVRVCALSWLINLFLVISSSTKVPDATHYVKWRNQGVVSYMTGWQHFILIWVWAIGLAFALIGHGLRFRSWWRNYKSTGR